MLTKTVNVILCTLSDSQCKHLDQGKSAELCSVSQNNQRRLHKGEVHGTSLGGGLGASLSRKDTNGAHILYLNIQITRKAQCLGNRKEVIYRRNWKLHEDWGTSTKCKVQHGISRINHKQ